MFTTSYKKSKRAIRRSRKVAKATSLARFAATFE